jgi:Anti-sigma-K factor rskA/Putative zinc-finger
MSPMSHAEAEEVLGAYALEAVPEAEMRRVEEHLRGCPEHRAAAAELRRTSALLPLTTEEGNPSPDLRARIVAAVKTTPPQPAEPVAPVSDTRHAWAVPQRRTSPFWTSTVPLRQLAVAAALMLALGIGGLVGYQLGHSTQSQVAYTFQGDPTAAPGAEARLIYFKDRKQAVVAVSGLPRLSSGQVYEMWLIKGGVPVGEGVSSSQTGDVAAQISGDVSQFQQFAITIEPGEQPLPTTKPILVGNLQGSSG